jgi:putative membrane protein
MRGAGILVMGAALALASGCSWWHGEEDSDGQRAVASKGGDSAFISDAAADGVAEVAMGRVASAQGSSFEVREFGMRMVNDHTSANADLQRLANERGLTVPSGPSGAHKRHLDELNGLSGADFDRRYMSMMVEDHQGAVAKFESEARNGSDASVRDFATRTLPTLRDHLKLAQDIAGRLGG